MLFFKECRKVMFSLTFLIYVAAVSAFYFTQFLSECEEPMEPPAPNGQDYGYIAKETPEVLMPDAAEGLVSEYLSETYTTYPFGFLKEVKLTETKREEMETIITEITGITKKELNHLKKLFSDEAEMPEISLSEGLDYSHFRDLMRTADRLIGGGSKYSDESIIEEFSRVPKTYEDARAEYDHFLNDDGITGAYARLFCDYLGIIVAILPVFVAASLASADRRSHMAPLIYSRKVSSARLVLTRYAALTAMLSLPVMLLSAAAQGKVALLYAGSQVAPFAIPCLAAQWLIPNILISAALGMLLTEAISLLAAVFVQGVWWIASIMGAAGVLAGKIGPFTLVCRHNSLVEANLFQGTLGHFVFNRCFYTAASAALILFTALIYNRKRKGGSICSSQKSH